jgi:hypothetical protein
MNRYRDIGQYLTPENIRYRRNPIYPTLPAHQEDIYIITSSGDRYDTLALQFYNDSTLWWIIASANNFEKSSLNVQPGVQLRIPYNKTEALRIFNEVNNTR